jgi:outer membrane protein
MLTRDSLARCGCRALFLSVVIILGNSAAAIAQTDTLSIDRALEIAHQHNLQLRIAENGMQSAALSHEELLTTKLPQFSFEGSAIYAPSSNHFGYDPAISNGGQFSGQIVARQSVYDGGIRSIRANQLGVDIDLRNKEYRMAERDLRYAVKQAFIEVLRSEREIQLDAESVSQLSDYLEKVQQLSGGGNASYTDLLKTKVQLSNAKISYEKSRGSFSLAKYALAELLGGIIDTMFIAAGTLDDSSAAAADSMLQAAPDSSTNLDLSLAALSIQHNQLEVDLTQQELSPTVSVIGDAGLLTSIDNLRVPYAERAGILGYSVGVLLEIPFFNWGATNLRVQQKQRAVSDLRFQSELTRRSIISETKQLRLQLIKVRERLSSLRDNEKSAEENFLLTKSKYTGGGTLSLEVLSAQQLLTDARLSELQAHADIQLLSARLEQLLTP